MNYIDPLNYLDDPEKPKYDEALDPLDPRKLKYIPPPPPRLAQEPPQVDAPEPMPAQSAGPQMPAWRTADDARESTRTALNADEELKQTIANRPKLQHAKGWKGALQTVGEMFLNPAVIHPNYTRQMDEYGQDVNAAEARAKIAGNQAEQQRRQAQAEAQGDLWAKQGNTAEYQQKKIEWEMEHPGEQYTPFGTGGIFNKRTGQVMREPTPPAPKVTAPHVQGVTDAQGNYRTIIVDPVTGEQKVIEGGRIGKPAKPAGGSGGGDQRGKPGQFQMAERTKANRLAEAEEEAAKETKLLTAELTNPYQKKGPDGKIAIDYDKLEPAKKEIQDRLAKKKQQIQEAYLQEVVNLGGNIAQERAPALQGVGTAPPKQAAAQKLLPEFTSKAGHVFRAGQPQTTRDGKKGIIEGFNPDGSVVFKKGTLRNPDGSLVTE